MDLYQITHPHADSYFPQPAKRPLRHCTSRKAVNNTITTNLPQSAENAANELASQHLSLAY
jgi:hypothetical protein